MYTKEQLKLIKAYVRLVKKAGFFPGRSELANAGYSRDKIRTLFTNLDLLKKEAYSWAEDNDPEAFSGIINEDIFTPENLKALQKKAKQYKRFVVTTAVAGCPVHEGFLESIKTYCKRKDAMLLVLPSADPASTGSNTWNMAPELGVESIVFSDLQLNSNLFICSIKLSVSKLTRLPGWIKLDNAMAPLSMPLPSNVSNSCQLVTSSILMRR